MAIIIYFVIGFLFLEWAWECKFIRLVISLVLDKAIEMGRGKIFVFLATVIATILILTTWPISFVYAFRKD